MFEAPGITDTTLAVYRALQEHPDVIPAEIGAVLDLPAMAVEEQLHLLRKHELVVVMKPRSSSVRSAPTSVCNKSCRLFPQGE